MQGAYSAYSAYCNMQNMLNMSNNMLLYAKQYAKYAFFGRQLSLCLVWVEALMRSQQKATGKLCPSSGSHAHAQSSSLITDHRGDSSGWDDCSCTSALLSRPVLCNPSFISHSERQEFLNGCIQQSFNSRIYKILRICKICQICIICLKCRI